MALPEGLTTITVTGTYLNALGIPLSGSVSFTPSAAVMDASGEVVIAALPVTAQLSAGSFSITLPCTDNAGLVPAGWLFTAVVAVPGSQQSFPCYLPHALGSTVDITALAPVSGSPSPSGVAYLPNASTVPATGPSLGGGFLYAENGVLYWLNGDNTPTPVGPGTANGVIPPAGDIGGTTLSPTVTSTHLTEALPVSQGGFPAGADGRISPSYLPRPTLYDPDGLRRWRAALGDSLFSQVPVVCVGDSITAGQGGDNNLTTFNNVPDNTNGWVGQLRSLLAVAYGTAPGEGFLFADDSRITWAGGTTNNNWACVPLRHGPRLLHGSGNTLALTVPSGVTSVGVIQANETQAFNAAGTNLQDVSALYSQTGSTVVNNVPITTLTNTGLPIETDITCVAGDTITVSAPASAQSYIAGFTYKTANPGILVHRVGQAGYVSGDMLGGQLSGTLIQSASTANQVTAARSIYYWAGAQGMVIVSFGVNDQQFQQGGGSSNQNDVTLARYTTWMEQFCTQAVTDGWCCLILGEPRSPFPGAGSTQDQYWAAMQAFALATDHVAFIDVGEFWGSNAAASALNLASTSSVHPNRRGHGDIARMLNRVVSADTAGIAELTAA